MLSTACLMSCATPYQPEGYSGGYSDMKLGKDLYQVSFSGNGYTGSDTVQAFFLRRCADLTIEQGYEFFILVNQEAGATQYSTGTTHNGTVSRDYYGGYNYSGSSNTTTVTKHGRTGVIKIFKEGAQPEISYDAREILKHYERKPASQ